jgi:hypothetical protein
MTNSKRTEKHEEARNSIPDDLKSIFDELVEDYKFATVKRYGNGYVAYSVLADLIRIGWRHVAEPLAEEQ